jgi:O-antigen/teichoic acid export membrane protein
MSGRIGRTAALYFISQVTSTVSGFLATWFIANRLGSEILGEYTLVVTMLFFFNIPASAIGRAMNKRMSETGDHRSFLSAGHFLNAVATIVLVTVVILATEQINALANGRPVAFYVACLIAVQGLFDLVVASLRGTKQVEQSGFLKTFERVLRAALQIGVIVASLGFVWLLVGHIVAVLLAVVAGAAALRIFPTYPSIKKMQSLLEFARYGWLATMKTRAHANMDTLVLGIYAASSGIGTVTVSHSQIGIYRAAWAFATTLGLLSVSINQTLFPELSDLGASEDYDAVRNLVNEGLAFTGLLAIPGLVGSAALGGDLLTIYRPTFAQGRWILVILVAAQLFSSYNRQLVGTLSALNRPDLSFQINMLFLIINIVANIVLIALFGWYGAALATMATAGISVLFAAYTLNTIVDDIPIPTRTLSAEILAALLMGVIILGLQRITPGGAGPAVGLVFAGAGIYGLALFGISVRFRDKVYGIIPSYR